MAGLGAKLFTAFSKLTAAQVNGYLMDQSIMRFASTAARDAAFGGAGEPTLAEGMTCYLDDTNQIQSYNGSAWVGVAASSTVADVSSGLVYISTTSLSAFSTNITGCFTSAYTNYRIVFSYIGSTANACYIRFLVGSTVQTGNILSSNFGTQQSVPTTIVGSSRGDQYAQFATAYTVYPSTAVIDVYSPQAVGYTSYAGFAQLGLSSSDSYGVNLYGRNIATTQIDGFEITTATGASVLTGSVTIYGYRKA
jgi:hypothetical protein